MANTRKPLTLERKLPKMLLPPLNNLPLQPGHRHEMFNSLEDELKRDEQATSTRTQRWLRYATVLLASIILFGGLYAGIRFLE